MAVECTAERAVLLHHDEHVTDLVIPEGGDGAVSVRSPANRSGLALAPIAEISGPSSAAQHRSVSIHSASVAQT